ncbi:MAG TPA: nodulation protein NfeD [Spongiibacteraceae bacterium]|nr:nodulation protein NfeD [Spongiibacteraceae bacterium]
MKRAMVVMRGLCVAAALMSASGSWSATTATAEPVPQAWLLTLHGAVGPASADYIIRNLQHAQSAHVPIVMLQIDTPGGLDESMRDIVQHILDSSVPVVCLVAPAGARAASAGTYLLYACHIAAMAHATHLGAATPVAIGVPQGLGEKDEQRDDKASKAGDGDAMHAKVVNDAAAYIRTLAQLRGRNAEWAVQAVRNAATLTATEALAAGVIDLIAENPAELLQRIDGRQVQLQRDRRPLSLHTADLSIQEILPDWRNQFLAVITNPNVAYVLMLIGIYGLVLEFYSPGAILPGTLGGICLLVALYAFQVLPISYSGLALVLLGLALMIAETMVASFGVLGLSGIAAFALGSILLFDTELPAFRVALSLILAFASVSAAFLILVVAWLLKARRRLPVSGMESWVGASGEACADFQVQGLVNVRGELWQARTTSPLHRGQRITVAAIDGLQLQVAPATEQEQTS